MHDNNIFFNSPALAKFYQRVMDCRAETGEVSPQFKLNVLLETFKALEGKPLDQWDEFYTDPCQVIPVLNEIKYMEHFYRGQGKPFYHTLVNLSTRAKQFLSEQHKVSGI